MGSLVIQIPGVPASDLMPNRIRNNHWAAYNRLRQEQKNEAHKQVKFALAGAPSPMPDDAYPDVRVRVVWPVNRTLADLDNLIAGIKGALDGIFLALERDDKDMQDLCISQARAEPGDKAGMVEVVLSWT